MWSRFAGDVAGDEDVRALVDGDRAARREQLLGARLQLVGVRVAHGDEARLERRQLELLLGLAAS